jgi:plasmid stability protein
MPIKVTNQRSLTTGITKTIQVQALKKIRSLEGQFRTIAKESVTDVQAVDTGNLRSKTIHTITARPKKIIVEYSTRRVDYAIFVYFGLGSNRRYGARKYNLISAQKTAQLVATGNYNRIYKQGA